MPRCDGCTAYEPWDGGIGRCHLNPPSGVRDARNDMWTPFPLVEPQWWCAQHRPRPESESQRHIVGNGPPPVEDDFNVYQS